MELQDLVRISVETFSKSTGIPIHAIKVMSVNEGHEMANPPGPGQVSTQQLMSVVNINVNAGGKHYVLTSPRSGRGQVKWHFLG